MTGEEWDLETYASAAQAQQMRSYFAGQLRFWEFRMQSGLTADPREGPDLKQEIAHCDAEIERLTEGSRP